MTKKINKLVAVMLAGCIISTSFCVNAKMIATPVTVMLDNKTIGTGYISKDGSTMIPIRVLSETLNYQVSWNGKEQEVTISNGAHTISLIVEYHNAKVDNKWVQLQSVPEMINGTVYVPLRAVADTLGLEIGYMNQTAYLASEGKTIHLPNGNKQITLEELPTLLLGNGYVRFSNANIDYIKYAKDESGFPYQISFAQVVPDAQLMTLSLHENNTENLAFAKLLLQSIIPTKADEIYKIITTQDIIPLQVFEQGAYKVAIIAKENHSSLEITLDATANEEYINNIRNHSN